MSDAEDDLFDNQNQNNRTHRYDREKESLTKWKQKIEVLYLTVQKSIEENYENQRKEKIKIKIPRKYVQLSTSIETGKGTIIGGHLASPITADDQEAIINFRDDSMRCPRHKMWNEIRKRNTIDYHVNSSISRCLIFPCIKSLINQFIEDHVDENRNHITNQLKRIIKLGLKNTQIKFANFSKISHGSLEDSYNNYDKLFSSLKEEIELKIHILLPIYIDKLRADIMKDLFTNRRSLFNKLIQISYNTYLDSETCIHYCSTHQKIVLFPVSQLIMVLDLMQSKFPVVLNWVMTDTMQTYGEWKILDNGIKLFEVIDRHRDAKNDNEFYSFLNKWDALLIGYVISSPEDIGCVELYEETYSSLNYPEKQLVENYLLPQSNKISEIRGRFELIGISKCFGHPCLKVLDSLNVVREYGGMEIKVCPTTALKVANKFKEYFCKSYYLKHNKYPPIKEGGTNLHDILSTHRRIYRSDDLKDHHWNLIDLDTILVYDYSIDETELLKDTAIAPPMSQCYSQFDSCAMWELYKKRRPMHASELHQKRVILFYLQEMSKNIKIKLDQLEKGYFDPEDNTAVFCRKERELKPSGRAFVKQTYLQRGAQVSREKNLADEVLPYFEEQTMTSSEAQVIKRQQQMTEGNKDHYTNFNIDFSKWNLHFRYSLIHPIGKVLDQLFGTKYLFSEVHRWFLSCKIFANSRLTPPDCDSDGKPIPGPYFIDNHQGGGEGMCQKLWTLITIVLIKMVAEEQKVSISIMGQGDNQVIRLDTRKTHDPALLRKTFLNSLEQKFSSVGLVLKSQETWYSCRLFEFGKTRYLLGSPVAMVTKLLARLITDVNDGIVTIQSSLAQINTTTEGATKTEPTAIKTYTINQVETLHYFFRLKLVNHKDTDTFIEKFLYFPTVLGGFPSSTVLNHSVRGIDDNLPQWLDLIRDLRYLYPSLYLKVIEMIDLNPLQRKNYLQLFSDIRSLPIQSLKSTENLVKNATKLFLEKNREFVKNPNILKLFDPTLSTPLEMIVSDLSTMQPLFLPICHEIIRFSNAGCLLTLSNKLTNISTITRVISEDTGCDFLFISQLNTQDIINELQNRKISNPKETIQLLEAPNICPKGLADWLRETMWGLDLQSPSKPPPTHQFLLKSYDRIPANIRDNTIVITTTDHLKQCDISGLLTRGTYQSYIGNKTNEKFVKPIIELSIRDSPFKNYKGLATIKSWTEKMGAENLRNLVLNLMSEKIPDLPEIVQTLDVESICPIITGGNIVHRLKAANEQRVGIRNTNSTIGSHVRYSTNNLTRYTKGGDDTLLHFQTAFLYSECQIALLKITNNPIYPQYGLIINCEKCTEDVTVVKFDLKKQIHYQPKYHLNMTMETIADDMSTISGFGGIIEMRKTMSVLIGRQIGASLESEISTSMFSKNINDHSQETGKIGNLSTYYYQTLNFDYMLAGMFYESKIFRKNAWERSIIPINSSTNILVKFSNQLLESGRLNDLYNWLGKVPVSHGECFEANQLSTSILPDLINKCHDKLPQLIENLFIPVFSDDSVNRVGEIMTWLRGINGSIRSKISKDSHYTPTANELSVMKIVRQNFSTGVFKDSYKRGHQIPGQREIMSRELNSIHLSTFCEGNINSPYYKIVKIDCKLMLSLYKAYNTLDRVYIRSTRTLIPSYNTPPQPGNYVLGYPLSKKNILEEKYRIFNKQEEKEKNFTLRFIQHSARIFGRISTGICKYLELMSSLNLLDKCNFDHILCLAEGSGSVCWGLSKFFDCDMGYNTLLTPEVDIRKHQEQRIPATSLGDPEFSSRLRNLELTAQGETDITQPEFIRKFLIVIRQYDRILITLDAESTQNNSNFNILQIYINQMLIRTNISMMICKVLIPEITWYKTLYSLISKIPDIDYIYGLFKPISSHPCNGECFVVIIRRKHFPLLAQRKIEEIIVKNIDQFSLSYPLKSFSNDIFKDYIELTTELNRYFVRECGVVEKNMIYRGINNSLISYGDICSEFCWNSMWNDESIINNIKKGLKKDNEMTLNMYTRFKGFERVYTDAYIQLVLVILADYIDMKNTKDNLHLFFPHLKDLCIIVSNNYRTVDISIIREGDSVLLEYDGINLVIRVFDNDRCKEFFRGFSVCRCPSDVPPKSCIRILNKFYLLLYVMSPLYADTPEILPKFRKLNYYDTSFKATDLLPWQVLTKNQLGNFRRHVISSLVE
ncbi:RNA-dependent RNA polymerase [Drosophila unispina virus 1]|uniref:Replicase n=1 Tax=Drosophila unispina virus 1 TaxID=1802951 RepID=A0A140D8N6_9MONO|nr:RNA-dependent RNA polymerase [Drosophila unispina virus 1]AMK09260.1 RNA-dependent RNA polymerase [Drosophila unispina virus 1]